MFEHYRISNKFSVMAKRLLSRSFVLFIFAGCLLFFLVSFSHKDTSKGIEESCRTLVLNNISRITDHLNASLKILDTRSLKGKKVKKLINEFHEARKYYKEVEFFIEYHSPIDTKYYINGPLVPKYEADYGLPLTEPQGFQVIEECLFNRDKTNFNVLKKQYELLISNFAVMREYYTTVNFEHANLTEALRLQVIRVMCLTLNGYDCTINKETLAECAFSFDGIITILNFYKGGNFDNPKLQEAISQLQKCNTQLRSNPDSDNFNRLLFTTKFLDPAYKALSEYFLSLNLTPSKAAYPFNFKVSSVFENSFLNVDHFSVYRNDTANKNLQAALGKFLFFDPILSGNNKRACASCHLPSKAFTDGLAKSMAFDGKSDVGRNAPTLLNVAFQKFFFDDGRVASLEGQAHRVFDNPIELNTNSAEIVDKLKQSPEYRLLFRNAFKGRPDTSITFFAVLKCIAEFEKTLDARNSKFDKYLRGDETQLSANEINGYNLFAGKALCGSCHFFPLFNSTVPPIYLENEYEVIGTPEKADNKTLDMDIGREKISHVSIHNRAFKTPTVRNIAVTGPYMHNGVYTTLDQILDFYNKGGGAGFKLKVENQTLPFDSLRLSKKELNDIKSFLLALTDTSNIPKVPSRLPKFDNAEWDKRKIGGEY